MPHRILLASCMAALLINISAGPPLAYPADGAASGRESAEMARLRQEAKGRRRRLIYNNDGNDMSLKRHATPQEFLAQRINPALNTQVDSIFYCTGGTTHYDHETSVADTSFYLHEQFNFKDTQPINRHANMRMLRKAGVDCLSLVTDHVHEAGFEVFWDPPHQRYPR
jgi:hypothetical protein